MAKSNQRGEKGAAIRELLKVNPKMPTKDIVATLAAKGIKVHSNYVYSLKVKMHSRRRRQKREAAEAAGKSAGLVNPVELVRRIKQLASDAGGLATLKELVEVLGE